MLELLTVSIYKSIYYYVLNALLMRFPLGRTNTT